jgi:chromosome segregation ATPase
VPLEAFEQFAAKTVVSTVQAISASNLRHAKFIDDSYEKQFNQQRKEHAANFRAAAKTQKQEHDERVNTLKQEHEERVNTLKKEHEEKSSFQESTIAILRNNRDDLRLRLGQAVTELKMTERQYEQAEVRLHEKDELIGKLRAKIQWLESCPRYVFPSLNRRLSFNIE